MNNTTKLAIRRVLADLIPGTGLIIQNGAQWKFARPVQGLEAFSTRTFGSQKEAMDILAQHYDRQFEGAEGDNVTGLRPGTVGEQQVPNSVQQSQENVPQPGVNKKVG